MNNLMWIVSDFVIKDEKVFFVPYYFNLLCVFDLKINKMENMIAIPKSSAIQNGISGVHLVGENVVLVPAGENYIYVYNINNKNIKSIPLDGQNEYYCVAYYKKFMYIFSSNGGDILRLNTESWEKKYIPNDDSIEKNFFAAQTVNDKIYLVNRTNRVTVFDCKTERIDEVVELISSDIFTIKYVKEKFILSDFAGNIYVGDKISELIQLHNKMDFGPNYCCEYNGNIYYLPSSGINKVSVLSSELTVETFALPDPIIRHSWGAHWYSKPYGFEDKIYVGSVLEKVLLEIDTRSGDVKKIAMDCSELSKDIMNNHMDLYIKNGNVLIEGENTGDLSIYINYLV